MSDSQWMPIESIPMDGTVVYVRVVQAMRFQPYKPNSEQFRNGIKGRWQRLNEYGGWDSCDAPNGEYWKMAESGEPVKYGCHVSVAYGSPVFEDCDSSCAAPMDKEKCPHWRPIK